MTDKGIDMLYVKNLPAWERLLRTAVGIGALVFAYLNLSVSALGIGIGLVGAVVSMTGLIGFCPMCAMLGRKLGERQ